MGRRLLGLLTLATLAFFAASAMVPFSAPVEHAFAFGLAGSMGAALIAVAVDPASIASHLCNSPVLRVAGKYSYGIYVYSIFLHDTFKRYLLPPIANAIHGRVASGIVYLLVVTSLTLLVCIASYHLLEMPFLRLKRGGRGRV